MRINNFISQKKPLYSKILKNHKKSKFWLKHKKQKRQ